MAYYIEYGSKIPPRYRKAASARLRLMTALCLLLFSVLVRQFWPEGVLELRQYLLPVPPSVTQQALNTFVSDLWEGDPFGASFTAFCRHIVSHEQALVD